MCKSDFLVLILVALHVFCTCTTEALNCSASQASCCDNNYCIMRQWICDGEEDCQDGSDEEDCVRCLPYKWMCADGNLCIHEHWRCDGQADCKDASDELACEVDVIVLIVDFNGPIYKIKASDGTSSVLAHDSRGAENIAYDRLEKHVYWSNVRSHQINRININGEGQTEILSVYRCQGLVVDHFSRLLFYSDDTTKTISKMNIQTNLSTEIVSLSSSNRPHDITADLRNKKIYWTELGDAPRIVMSDYNGRERVVLLQQAGNKPTALALDSIGTTLFWCDEVEENGDLMAIDLVTKRSRTVPYGRTGNLFDIDILDTTLYMIDRHKSSAYLTMPETGGQPETKATPSGMYQYRHIKVLSSTHRSKCSQI